MRCLEFSQEKAAEWNLTSVTLYPIAEYKERVCDAQILRKMR
jgi:hypothetical protein